MYLTTQVSFYYLRSMKIQLMRDEPKISIWNNIMA